MSWFKRSKKQEVPPVVIAPPPTSRTEVELHKDASEKAAQKAMIVNEHLKDLLVENGITLKIALAAGAQIHHKKCYNTNISRATSEVCCAANSRQRLHL